MENRKDTPSGNGAAVLEVHSVRVASCDSEASSGVDKRAIEFLQGSGFIKLEVKPADCRHVYAAAPRGELFLEVAHGARSRFRIISAKGEEIENGLTIFLSSPSSPNDLWDFMGDGETLKMWEIRAVPVAGASPRGEAEKGDGDGGEREKALDSESVPDSSGGAVPPPEISPSSGNEETFPPPASAGEDSADEPADERPENPAPIHPPAQRSFLRPRAQPRKAGKRMKNDESAADRAAEKLGCGQMNGNQVDGVLAEVCRECGIVSLDEFKEVRRGRAHTRARRIAAYLFCERYGLPAANAAEVLGLKHGGTIYALKEEGERLYESDQRLKDLADRIGALFPFAPFGPYSSPHPTGGGTSAGGTEEKAVRLSAEAGDSPDAIENVVLFSFAQFFSVEELGRAFAVSPDEALRRIGAAVLFLNTRGDLARRIFSLKSIVGERKI